MGAFPCNQFGEQEPGGGEDICKVADQYNTKFLMMSKIDVNGDGMHPVYRFLRSGGGGDDLGPDIAWNFATLFLVHCGRETCDIHRYDDHTLPSALEPMIKSMLGLREEL